MNMSPASRFTGSFHSRASYPPDVRPGYRPDIDGLRAISILAVVLYHAWPDKVTGGFIGVDIFFVISGFLITGIVTRELAMQSFSVLGFYRRRIRRIFPALIVVLIVIFAAGWFILMPGDFEQLGWNIAGGAGFFSNLVQLQATGYFAPEASTNPLLHLWSLGIEEQFYIVWPLLLVILAGRRAGLPVILVLFAASFILNVCLVANHQAIAFYSPMTRAWELLAGALLVRWQTASHASGNDNVKGFAGLFLIGAAIVVLNNASTYPGAAALMPVAGAVLLLDAPRSLVNRYVLAQPVSVFIGLISYPLYLWHWPLLSYLGMLRGNDPTDPEKFITLCVAFLLAYLTYRLVEIPVRSKSRSASILAIAMAATGVLGAFTILEAGFGARFPAEVREIADLPPKQNSGFRAPCFLEGGEAFPVGRESCLEDGSAPLVFVWGDSTAAVLYPGLKAQQASHAFRIAQFTAAACPPVLATDTVATAMCETINQSTFDYVKSSRPQIVILHAMWDLFSDFEHLRVTIAELKRIGIPRIVVLGPTPIWKRALPSVMVNAYRFHHVLPERLSIGVSGPAVDEQMRKFASDERVEYLSAWKAFCDAQGCQTRLGPDAMDVIIWDRVHLSTRASEFLGRIIVSDLLGPPQGK